MVNGGPTIPPSSSGGGGADPLQALLNSVDVGRAEVTRATAELRVLTQATRLEAQVIRVNDNGTVTLQTARGEVDVRPPVPLQQGQTVQIRLDAGAPPAQARIALPQNTQPQNVVVTQTSNTPPPQTQSPDTTLTSQAAQSYDRPPIPAGSSAPVRVIPIPIPPTQTGVEVLLRAVFNGGVVQTQSSVDAPLATATQAQQTLQLLSQSLAQPQNSASSQQTAPNQAPLPPPIVEGLQTLQVLRTALTARSFNPAPLLSSLTGVQTTPQTLPVTGLPLTPVPPAISPLVILPSGATSAQPLINTEIPATGVRALIASAFNQGAGSPNQTLTLQPQLGAARVLITQPPGQLIQIPNFPISTTPQVAGQPSPLFFGLALGQNASGESILLGNNGLVIVGREAVSRPFLPGTVIVAQNAAALGANITTPPNINAFNIPTVGFEKILLGFDPVYGDRWPALEEALKLLTQIDPGFAGNIRASVPNPSTPAQLPTSILFFLAATGVGDVRAWIGDRALELLNQAGRGDLSRILGSDFASIAGRAAEQTPDGWRPFMIPMFFGDDIHRMQFFTRHHDGGGDEDGQSGQKTRFLVNVEQTKIGPIQLDGLVQAQRLDMVLRSDEILSQEMRQGVRKHYANALKNSDLTGAIHFEHGDGQWVEVSGVAMEESVII